jgi:hypothetical protein
MLTLICEFCILSFAAIFSITKNGSTDLITCENVVLGGKL